VVLAPAGPTSQLRGSRLEADELVRPRSRPTPVEFLRGYIEDIPLPAGTIDVVVSNCVIDLC